MENSHNEIILQKRIAAGDLSAYKQIVDYYQDNSPEIYTKRQLISNMEMEANNGNVFAMLVLSNWYKDGSYVDLDNGRSLIYLQKIISSKIGKRVIDELKCSENEDQNWKLDTDNFLGTFKDVIGQAYYQLGLAFLGNSSSEKGVRLARKCLKNAELCGYECKFELGQANKKISGLTTGMLIGIAPLMAAVSDISKAFVGSGAIRAGMGMGMGVGIPALGAILLGGKILNSLCSDKKTDSNYKHPVLSYDLEKYCNDLKKKYQHSLLVDGELSFTNMYDDIENSFIEQFGDAGWNKLAPESRRYLLTGIFCFIQMYYTGKEQYKNMDFASAISPVMKALELELRIRFFDGYLDYLNKHYKTVYEYLKANKETIKGFPEETRRCVVLKNRKTGRLEFLNYKREKDYCKFTLGSFRFVIGLTNYINSMKNMSIDRTALNYCINDLFIIEKFVHNDEKDDSKDVLEYRIIQWLNDFCVQLEKLKDYRNHAAHGGEIMKISDAEFCFDEIVIVNRLLFTLVSVCK